MDTYRGITFTKFPSYDDFNPNLIQIKNLIDMAAAIQFSPPPNFDMAYFGNVTDFEDEKLKEIGFASSIFNLNPYHMKNIGNVEGGTVAHSCGTSACALGTAAFHGVGEINEDMTFWDYARVNFGTDETDVWAYLFAGDWEAIDNTSAGAAARILKLVSEGAETVVNQALDAVNGFDYESFSDKLSELESNDERVKDLVETYAEYLGVKVF